MASDIDICNLALAHLGDDATVSSIEPPEGSAQAEHCARFYPMTRDSLLTMHTWSFATKRADLAELADTPPDSWQYAYGIPNGCLRPVAVLSPSSLAQLTFDWFLGRDVHDIVNTSNPDNDTQDFVVETLTNGTKVVYTNIEQASMVFIARVTDTTKFDPLFVDALARLLASRLAGPIIKGSEGMKVSQGQLKWFKEVEYPDATKADSNARQSHPYMTAVPAPLMARQ